MDKLQKKRDEAAVALRTMLATAKEEGRGLSAEEKTKYDRMVADINEVDEMRKQEAEFEKLSKNEQLEARMIETVQKGIVDKDEDTEIFSRFLRNGETRGLQRADTNEKRMTSVTGSTGGFLIPEKFSAQLYSYLETDNVIRQLATKQKWSGDGAFPVVTAFGTAYLVTEGQAVTESDPTIAQKLVSGFQHMYAVDVPVKTLENSAYPLEAEILKWWAKNLAVLEEAKFANGAGTTEPIGLIDAATEGSATAIHTALGGDDIISWYHDLPHKYRSRASWIMADSSIKLIRQITNAVTTSGALNYIWAPGLGGNPDTLMGRPVYASAGMPAFAAGEEIGVFGDISQYIVVDFGTPMMIRDPYTKAKYHQVSFIGASLTDTALPVAEAVITLKIDAS